VQSQVAELVDAYSRVALCVAVCSY